MEKRILQNTKQKVRFNVHKEGTNDTNVDYNQSKKKEIMNLKGQKRFFRETINLAKRADVIKTY
jgi:hypothetical protein